MDKVGIQGLEAGESTMAACALKNWRVLYLLSKRSWKLQNKRDQGCSTSPRSFLEAPWRVIARSLSGKTEKTRLCYLQVAAESKR